MIKETSSVANFGIGRRKSARVQVNIIPGQGVIKVNNLLGEEYFSSSLESLKSCQMPLTLFDVEKNYDLIIKVSGGGLKGQTDAIVLAVSRAIAKLDPTKRTKLKSLGLLSRDTRVKERKKVGLKKARKASQYSKR